MPAGVRAMVLADVQASEAGKAVPAATDAELLAAIDELEKAGKFDHALNAYLWRKAVGPAKDPARQVELFDRVGRHARITDALL